MGWHPAGPDRGAWAFAPENTLEAYSAAMDHGADGCEIDLRRTNDGVLVMFHDDGMDRMTDALGRINQHSYAELLAIPFRSVYKAKPDTRIPTLASVLQLAHERAMLLHLDVKEPGLEEGITKLLDAADMWDHVVELNEWNASSQRKHPKVNRQSLQELGKLLAANLSGRTDLEGDAAQQERRARQILERAWAAQQIGRSVRLPDEFLRLVRQKKPGESAALAVLGPIGTGKRQVTVTLGRLEIGWPESK